eukprot:CAMPEP_0194482980 /NCGR_PEP_ID=MMETSP0253-20130528/4713_1 /TAXON_ID=2966 /ORGANISM="Noctiluca scintillans" /LENGTH=649 /DNA_ID=CAMNT_0039322573 /DNA_START=42 /DNA_END=1987 /DNA_ORIENTATION=-
MAFSAHKDDKRMEEFRESTENIDAKARALAQFIRDARHVVVFTGAGISTTAGIADYRGPQGVWTLQAKGEAHKIRSVEMTSAVPTPTHMSLVKLVNESLVHHVISQNVDGLHRKSGVPKEQMSELHGNSNVEYCTTCRREYFRDFPVEAQTLKAGCHQTGRRCVAAGCGGLLHDTIIHFGEALPVETVTQAFAQSESADLHVVLGSSLTVSPASDMPRSTLKRGGKLVIVNLQRTAQDAAATLRVHCGVDDLMNRLMFHLTLPVPPFKLLRSAALWRSGERLCCAALDADGAPATLFKSCTFSSEAVGEEVGCSVDQVILSTSQSHSGDASVRCSFFGHYGEPEVDLTLPQASSVRQFRFSLDPLVDTVWSLDRTDGGKVPSVEDILPGKGGAVNSQVKQQMPLEDTTDYSGWFAVEPADDCQHTACGVKSPDRFAFDLKQPCATCKNVGENMVCLACHEVHCGRHVQQHMLAHHESSGHPIVAGFVDLSFWCYGCDVYIKPTNKKILPYYAAMHTAKFGVPPPVWSGSAVESSAMDTSVGSKGVSKIPSVVSIPSGGGGSASWQSPVDVPMEDTTDYSGWFAVEPADDCQHTACGVKSPDRFTVDLKQPCATCKNVGENMVCLACHEVHCGRHVQQHMLAHHESSGHP